MVVINIKDSYVAANPTIAANPNAFILMIGDNKYPVMSVSRNMGSITEAVRNGSPAQINLRPGEQFGIENEIFETLVKASEAGNDTNLVDRLLYFINHGVVEVRQDGGSPMTAKQVLQYVAP